jgi:hypothetical protein
MMTRYCVSLLAVFCLSVVALAQKVNVDWQRGTDFSKYKTYAWGPPQHPVNDPLWNQRIVEQIDSQLTAKGLKKVSADQKPDLLVGYNAGVQQNVSWTGYRTGGPFMGGMGRVEPEVQKEGTLAVDLADPQQKMVIWRGTSTKTLADKSEKNIKNLQKMIGKMFEKYPPKS